MTFVDPAAGRNTIGAMELRKFATVWDTYDSTKHGSVRMNSFYPVIRHENWWGCGVPLNDLWALASSHGIPVAWVPSADVLRELAAVGPDHQEKLQVLIDARHDIVALSRQKLDECVDNWLGDTVTVARKSLSALADGHDEAAACLALLGSEDLIYEMSNLTRGAKYKDLTDNAKQQPVSLFAHSRYVLTPLTTLYTTWWAKDGDPVPTALSRHAVVHRLPLEHLSEGHCLIAVMLLVSMVREAQQRYERIRDDMLGDEAT
ncbi:hypothetical protein ACF09I_02210 [Streptomyces sp. NPDC014940]|uniref:hypothetical protein n=1 Tax=Streptomyces sp. NPDC014940 TaxID=3364932 RepID=UPI003701AC44